MYKKIRVLPFEQGGYKCLMGVMKASDLLKSVSFDTFDPSLPYDAPEQGYQVPDDPVRIKRLANFLRKEDNPVMPSSVVLSCRSIDAYYDSECGEITLSDNIVLRVLDGQRRISALRYAINKKGLVEFLNYDLPFVIIGTQNKFDEMKVFQTIQSTQKGMRTDVVNSILAQFTLNEKVTTIKASERWKVIVAEVIELLNNNEESPWFDCIVKPGGSRYSSLRIQQQRSLEHKRIVRATSFISSIKPVYNFLAELGFLKGTFSEQAAQLARILDNFWRAIRNKAPSMFEEANNYVLQKSAGIFALHLVLRDLLSDMFKGRREWTIQNFETMLEDFPSIITDSYWHVGDKIKAPGDATHFGSMKGFRQLADILLEERDNYRAKALPT